VANPRLFPLQRLVESIIQGRIQASAVNWWSVASFLCQFCKGYYRLCFLKKLVHHSTLLFVQKRSWP
jgi:hypothetical protein